jgi:hypothetical protein
MSVAIDFTASNKDRHTIVEGKLNEYEVAMQQVGKILENYSHKKLFSAYGFGGIPDFSQAYKNMPDHKKIAREAEHCFNLTGVKGKSTTKGLENLMKIYRIAAKGTELWGPTFFAPVLTMQKYFIDFNKDYPMYHVLLILTDGNIHDMRETIDLIVECSFEPLSVIIIGIGDDSDFAAMDILDADDVQLINGVGGPAQRDIVNFVKFNGVKRDYAQRAGIDIADVDINDGEFGDMLSEEVLAEVPE